MTGPGEGSRSRPRIDPAVAIRLLLALLIAGGVCAIVAIAYPDELSLRTDIVGYPAWAAFDVREYVAGFVLLTVAFPVLAIAIYALLARLERRRLPAPTAGAGRLPREAPAEPEPRPAAEGAPAGALAIARLALVGALLATAVAIALDGPDSWLATIFLPVAAAYVLGALALARLVGAETAPARQRTLAAINAIVGSFALVVLAVAADATHVVELDSGREVDYPFAPVWLLAAIGALVGIVVSALISRLEPERWRAAERAVLLVLVAPVFVFLFVAVLPGEQGSLDLFHQGERLTASALIGEGAFPWKDILFPHGLLFDVLMPALNRTAIDDSVWGLIAGDQIISSGLYWVSSFALCAWLFRRNWLFLLTTQVLLVLGSFAAFDNDRMLVVPLSMLALAALLAGPSWPRAFGLMAITLFGAIAVPEAAVFSATAWLAVVAYEVVHRRTPDAAADPFASTKRIVVAGIALGLCFVVFLVANGALGSFLDYYRTFVGGHDLTGGIPIFWVDDAFRFWAILPVAVILLAWAYGAWAAASGRWLTRADWVVLAMTAGLIAYYGKFLTRADPGHLYQVATVALIPAFYVAYRVIEWLDARALASGRRALAYRPATVAVALAALILAPRSPLDALETLPRQLEAASGGAAQADRVGYAHAGVLPAELINEVSAVVETYAGADGSVFDFTNSPALFGYVVDSNPATRYYHVSMAIPAEAQRDLISELEAERPELVAFTSLDHGLPGWDRISNSVRHYLVADYLLRNYRPAAAVDDYVFMVRDDLPLAPTGYPEPPVPETDLLFAGRTCDWGLVPAFLDQAPADPDDAVEVPIRAASPGLLVSANGWAADVEAGKPARGLLIVRGRRVLAESPTFIARPDVSAHYGNAALERSGFAASVRAPAADAGGEPLRYFAVSEEGVASEIAAPPEGADPLRSVITRTGERITVSEGAVAGLIESSATNQVPRYELELPADFGERSWLELGDPAGLGADDTFVLTDSVPGSGREIHFGAGPEASESLRVRVGSCPQWHGYRERTLSLYPSAEPPASVRLIR